MNRDRSKSEEAGADRVVRYEVSYLRMDSAPAAPRKAFPAEYAVRRLRRPATADFRRLYDGVGSDYAWTDMHSVPRRELDGFVQDPRVEFYLLLKGDSDEAGFYQLDFRRQETDGSAELAFFGLMPAHRGKGLGGRLLDDSIRRAWRREIVRLDVNTCTLDHPAALALYLRAGFRVDRVEERTRDGASAGWR